jgi:hypothetical protein
LGLLQKWRYANDKWTTISTEYAQGRFNYTYGGDVNNDGASGNDLIFLPTTAEISTMIFSGALDKW